MEKEKMQFFTSGTGVTDIKLHVMLCFSLLNFN